MCVGCSVFSNPLGPHGATRLLCPWGCPGKNPGVDCHFLLQGIFLVQGLNLHLLHLPALAGGFFTTCATEEIYVGDEERMNSRITLQYQLSPNLCQGTCKAVTLL